MEQMFSITMDCVCALYTLIILLYLRLSSDRKDKLNLLLGWVCLLNIGMLLGDIPNWLCEGFAKPWFPLVLNTGTFIQYLSGCLAPWVYSLYLYTYLSRKAKLERWILPTIHTMFVVNAILFIFGVLCKKYYFIDVNNTYQRGDWYLISQAMPIIILVFDAVIVMWHHRSIRKQDTLAFLSYLMLPIIGIIIQIYTYGISVTYLSCSIAILIIFLCIQSEQRLLHEQQKRDLDNAHLQVMLSQIQPHFLYNSLLGIKQLCDTNPPRASEALEHFSFYLRGNLNSITNTQLVPFAKEIVHIQDYLYLEKMRFDERLNIEWDLAYSDFLVPPLTVQPLIENAIRHGISKKECGGTLIIKSERVNDNVIITITDNGVGFDLNASPKDDRAHIGVENTRKRIETLCGGTLHINSQVDVGTTSKIVLPLSEVND